jgi:CBS domain containing-hemolysin-like protein
LTESVDKHVPSRRRAKTHTTAIYEKEDLKEFISHQRRARNNRIPEKELANVLQVLDFGDRKIKDLMVPREDVHFVTPKEPIGPILISELHKTGHTCFPVKGNGENQIVGMLHLQDLIAHTTGGTVADAMNKMVVYVNESEEPTQVLQAFEKSSQKVFLAVNNEEEITGLISVEDVLNNLFGDSLRTAFDSFEDVRAVARGQEVAETDTDTD